MAAELVALCIDALDPAGLAHFWSELLGLQRSGVHDADGSPTLLPADDTGFRIRFRSTGTPKTRQNPMHFDLTSASLEQQQETVATALRLGGRHIDVGQLPEEEHVVLADPEGNELCVVEAGNSFLACCGFIGALSCDGSREVGCFWSAALGWPLVWDQDQETAIQSPRGGPKITWGGPPDVPKTDRNRLHLDIAPGGPHQAELDRLLGLGATRLDSGQCNDDWVTMADPDGNEFCVTSTS